MTTITAHSAANPARRKSRRTQVVWATFVSAMTFVCGVLLLADGSLQSVSGAPMLGAGQLIDPSPSQAGGLFKTDAPLDQGRWDGIVIHHSASPAGDAETLHREHMSHGLDGLGYHFVIGNGDGLGDGVVHLGYRWLNQIPGAHAIGPDQNYHNQHSIGICLIGNGESRGFTAAQMEALMSVVTQLQSRLGIVSDRVFLHREIADVQSPGRFFDASWFRERLIDRSR